MKIEILDVAESDLAAARAFYDSQSPGLGEYFLDSILADIESLVIHAGVHQRSFGYYRLLAKRFPFAIYYRKRRALVRVYAVLDCRRSPAWIRDRLR